MFNFAYSYIVALVVLAHASIAASNSSYLTEQLRDVLIEPDVPQSPEQANLVQSLYAYGGSIDRTYLSFEQSYGNPSAGASGVCKVSQSLFGSDQFLDASSMGYTNATEKNWSETSWLLPACILKPASPTGVAVLLKLIVSFDAKFATRSGGHNPNTGFGSINGSGVLLDLSNLNQLNISSDRKTITVGPGNRWIDVYSYLDNFGVSAIGTKEPGPGVGGSILGGGDPFFPGLHGFACDSVQDFEIVLSNSSLVKANANHNPNLFIALKGGASNFGIVTAFTLYTVPVHDTWYNVMSYSNASNTNLFKALVNFQQAAETDPKANVIFTVVGDTTVVGFLYAQHAEFPAVFSSFVGIPTTGTLITPTNGTVKQLCMAIGSLDSPGNAKRSIAAISTFFDSEYYGEAYDVYKDVAAALPLDTSLILSFQPVTRATVQQSQNHNTNSLGIELKAQNWFAVEVQWTTDDEDASSQNAVIGLTHALSTSAKIRAMLLSFVYQNDAGYFQKPLDGIGRKSLAALEAASMLYDPLRVFQRLQSSGFLLSRS